MATTSSITNFVRDFNIYFKCPSKDGKCKGKNTSFFEILTCSGHDAPINVGSAGEGVQTYGKDLTCSRSFQSNALPRGWERA
jgi:hypothetical protein